jgi:F-type H+-transporting ATPase subunit b
LSHRKQTPRLSSFVLLIALLFSLSVAPAVAIAQAADGTTAPSTAQPKAGSESVFKEEHKAEKETEADETSVYRHSPSVQWFAKLLHLDVETAAKLFEYINFAVIVLAIGIPLGRMLPKAMRQRKAKLSADLEVAQAKTQNANDRLKAVEEQMAGLDAEIAAIRKQVEEDMRSDEVRNKTLIEEETARIVASAEQEITVAAAQAQRGLKQFAADLAIGRAVSQLTVSAEADRALFAEFAADVAGGHGKRRAAKGGRS